MSDTKLSEADISGLLTASSSAARIKITNKIATHVEQGDLSETERQLAAQIFRLMAQDVEVRVRQTLADRLKDSGELPHDVAMALAGDIEAVALPVLQFSKVLTDSDLIEIVRSQSAEKQMAIAQRAEVSSAVSDALVDTGNREVVVHLMDNPHSVLSERAMQRIVDDFGEEVAIQGSLIQRAGLPITVAERLVSLVSDHLLEQLVARHPVSAAHAAAIVAESREKTTIALSSGAEREDVEGLVRHLHENGRLQPSLLLRAVCMGDMGFFEAGMAELAAISPTNVGRLIHDRGELGLHALYHKAKLPEKLFRAFRCAVDVSHETEFDGGELDRERFSRRMIERILTQYEEIGATFDSGDLDYLLSKVNQLPAGLGSPL